MGKQIIISIGRECGSGGRIVAEYIGDKLGIEVLDKNILDDVHEEKKIDLKSLHKYDEKARAIGRIMGVSKGNEVTRAIWDYIKEKAEKGDSFVIVGRCAEEVLKDNPNLLSVFVTAPRYDKFARIVDSYGFTEEEAEELRVRTDEDRQKFHDRNSNSKWGAPSSYDLVVNTSALGIKGAAEAIIRAIDIKAEYIPEADNKKDDYERKVRYFRRVNAGF